VILLVTLAQKEDCVLAADVCHREHGMSGQLLPAPTRCIAGCARESVADAVARGYSRGWGRLCVDPKILLRPAETPLATELIVLGRYGHWPSVLELGVGLPRAVVGRSRADAEDVFVFGTSSEPREGQAGAEVGQ